MLYIFFASFFSSSSLTFFQIFQKCFYFVALNNFSTNLSDFFLFHRPQYLFKKWVRSGLFLLKFAHT